MLSDLERWAAMNCLKINPMKTKVILYMPGGKTLTTNMNLCLGCQKLEQVGSVNILGVDFSKHLTWNEHVDYL